MEGRNSPVRSMASKLNGGEGVGPSDWGAALGSGEALGSVYGESGGVRWLGTDEAVENKGGCGGDGLPEADTARVRTRCRCVLLLQLRIPWGQCGPVQGDGEGGDGLARR
jgi:hypothetical protein